jgi:hypothetical protein
MLKINLIRQLFTKNTGLLNRRTFVASSKLLNQSQTNSQEPQNASKIGHQESDAESENLTHFGFETVKKDEKAKKGNQVSVPKTLN